MRTLLRFFAVLVFIGAAATALGYFVWYKPKFKGNASHFKIKFNNNTGRPAAEKYKLPLEKLATVSSQLKLFAEKRRYNNQIAFLIDMSLPSGRQRFFVYNMVKDSVEMAGLVAHGYGSAKAAIEFSNIPGSYCSSLGRYKIGSSYNGRFGLAYKLHGLDKTNDKAFERFVVLHAHDCVPVNEIAPLSICESQGCPTVAPRFLEELKKYLDNSEKPVLLTIYQ